MINLLPPKEKEELFLEKTRNFIVILGNIILISLFCLILILLSINIYIWGEVTSQKLILEQTKEKYETSEIKNFQKILKEHNKDILKLKEFYQKQVYFPDILEKLSKIIPSEIYFTNISFRKEKDDGITAAISGFSKKRENLTLFKENLEKEKNFENLDFSPTSWIKPVDADFYLTFKITK